VGLAATRSCNGHRRATMMPMSHDACGFVVRRPFPSASPPVTTRQPAAAIAAIDAADHRRTREGHMGDIAMTTVGTGTYRYEYLQDFPKLPAGQVFGIVNTVATDSQDCLYVFQCTDHPGHCQVNWQSLKPLPLGGCFGCR
jgi:hypothetical protein